MSYPQADNRIVTYPLNSIIGSGGAPRYAFVEPVGGKVVIESDRISPLRAGSLEFTPSEMIPANVLSPSLPFFQRNSLLDLDSFQNVTGKIENERDLEALQLELAMENSQIQKLAEAQEKESRLKIGIKEIAAISGIGLTATIVLFLILRRKKK